MSTRLIARLDLLAAASERFWTEEVSRSQASLQQAARSRELLHIYRARLAQSWGGGGAWPAAQAQRAAMFSGASREADFQIDQLEVRAGQQLQAALWQLAELRARRNQLRAQARTGARLQADKLERALERDQPASRKPARQTSNIF